MIFAPAALLLVLSSLSTIATAAPHLTPRQQNINPFSDLGSDLPEKCRDQCNAIDADINKCTGGSEDKAAACVCTNDILGRTSKCFACVASEVKDQEPDAEQTLQGAMDVITGACNTAGFKVNSQSLAASRNGGVGLNREASLKLSALGIGMGVLMLSV
ncbi:hypothetical protein Moror_5550 [Moniliophthora roreri MCA 2997]|uniref:Extracellular membrane protein CFEM domain-containing protein n=1 Tax=Moniliophthora roreri (strain MCA 2997) TaxID=1381753 RepID=V2X320_MONRO|nr:hypothetical protein Moror_5550 [Moniliophthora roreri MCA 2997]